MDINHKHWNEQQKALEEALRRPADHRAAIDLFLSQHAMVHASAMSQSGIWSFDDEVWQGLSEDASRRIPPKGEHSVDWLMWHAARCEDITMNMLIAGTPQVMSCEPWLERMNITIRDTGNAMSLAEIESFSSAVNVAAIRDYRTAVGRRTREVIPQLAPGSFKQKVDPARIAWVLAEGAVVEQAHQISDYWGSRTIAGLMLMPATRHNLVHLNEAMRMKKKVKE